MWNRVAVLRDAFEGGISTIIDRLSEPSISQVAPDQVFKLSSLLEPQYLLQSLAIAAPILLFVIGIFVDRLFKRRRLQRMFRDSLALITDELKSDLKLLMTMAVKSNWRPYNYLRTEAKEALWSRILDLSAVLKRREAQALGQINDLYGEYDLLNRQLDILFTQGVNAPIYHQSTYPLAIDLLNRTSDFLEHQLGEEKFEKLSESYSSEILGTNLIEFRENTFRASYLNGQEETSFRHQTYENLVMESMSTRTRKRENSKCVLCFARCLLELLLNVYDVPDSSIEIELSIEDELRRSSDLSSIFKASVDRLGGLPVTLIILLPPIEFKNPERRNIPAQELKIPLYFSCDIQGLFVGSRLLGLESGVEKGFIKGLKELCADIGDRISNFYRIQEGSPRSQLRDLRQMRMHRLDETMSYVSERTKETKE